MADVCEMELVMASKLVVQALTDLSATFLGAAIGAWVSTRITVRQGHKCRLDKARAARNACRELKEQLRKYSHNQAIDQSHAAHVRNAWNRIYASFAEGDDPRLRDLYDILADWPENQGQAQLVQAYRASRDALECLQTRYCVPQGTEIPMPLTRSPKDLNREYAIAYQGFHDLDTP